MKPTVTVVLALLVAIGIAGCGEREQTTLYKDGKYRGKPDTKPWDNAPPAYGTAGWAKGDYESWENQVKARNSAQNEYRRIGH